MRTRSLAIAACCLTLAACTASADSPPAASSSSPIVPPSASPAVASPSPAASAPASRPASRPATPPADGTDLDACRDGTCQVLLAGKAQLKMGRKFGIYRLYLTHKDPNRLEFSVVRDNGSTVNGYLGGEGYLSLAPALTVRVEHHDRAGATLRFEPKAKHRTSDQVSASDGASIFSNG